jgi:Fe2+ or Zn2+ uptake regulation protein
MKDIEYDTSEKGLRSVLKYYQEVALRVIWESPEGLGSRKVWEQVNSKLKDETVSRASIINFLEIMRERGVLQGVDETGKGGHRWIYSPAMNEAGFKQYVAERILANLKRDFPDETDEALRKL